MIVLRKYFAILIATAFTFLLATKLPAQSNYSVASVPDSMKKNVNAVIIDETLDITIERDGKYIMSVHKVVEILNEKGQDEAMVILPYDRFSKVNSLSAKIYNADGSPIRNKNLTEVDDFGYSSYGTLFSDMRYKVISPEWNEYPYVVVTDYTYTINEGINYPDWNPVQDFDISVLNAELNIQISPALNLRYYEKNLSENCKKTVNADNTRYTWTLSNQKAFHDEAYSPDIDDLVPEVLLSPSIIDFDGYQGDFLNWTNFGAWIAKVNNNTDLLQAVTVEKMKTLTADLPTKMAKIRAVYEYMQNKTRYVFIKVGIGGFKPIEAADVDRLGYGDCKALANYTRALLSAAGIKSYYTLINAGDEKDQIQSDFPSNQFNHAILCVPDENDTIWLECTSQTSPFNFLGKFTSDRYALLITEEGGKLVKTPEFHRGENVRSRNIAVILDKDGIGTASVRTIYSGDFYDDYRAILAEDKEGQKKAITENLHIPKFEFNDFSVAEGIKADPYAEENIKVSLTGYFTTVANKRIMQLNLMSKTERNPFNSRDRCNDIVFTWPYKSVDTVTYQLPEGYNPEKLPQPVNLSYDFANYRNEVTMEEGNLIYIRTLELIPGLYKKDRYKEFSAFFDKVASSDAMKIAIISNQ